MIYFQEIHVKNLFKYRKKTGLSPMDLAVLMLLITASRRRIIITESMIQLSEELAIGYSQLARCILQLRRMNYIHKITYKSHTGLIVNPMFVNAGNYNRRKLKVELWALAQDEFIKEQKAIQDKRLAKLESI